MTSTSDSAPPPVFILGPTGCGKSSVAIALAELMGNAEIISADAYQIYRGMPILTAAPAEDELARVPHHLIGCLSPAEPNDAATHARRALAIMEDLRTRGRQAIITGGSGLYVKFISHGISPAPPSAPQLRAELEKLPLSELVRRFQEVDPEGAAATDLHNPRYVQRNLEIVLLSGKPLAAWRSNWQPQACGPGFVIQRSTEDLDSRILSRAHEMIRCGAIRETAALGPLSPTAEKTLGLSQIRAHLKGELPAAELSAAIALATRQYAKRQRTWLRRESWLTPIPTAAEHSAEDIANIIHAALTHKN